MDRVMKKIFALIALALLALPTVASAADAGTPGGTVVTAGDNSRGLGILGACVGAGLVIIGAVALDKYRQKGSART